MEGTETLDILSMNDQAIEALMIELKTGLTVQEAKDIQKRILKRAPTIAELILFGIEGSEHCSYKSSRPYLKLFTTEGADVIVGAKEDAGIIRVAKDHQGNGYAIVLSHESHNHPSQIVPYEGAATGVGGNVRDVCCMGAKVVALADDLRFGDPKNTTNKRLYNQVVSGIAGYGNPIGVPNIGGGLQFDPSYDGNCLVTVVTLGAVREDHIVHSYAPPNAEGYDMILVGKPTDNSGFGGASFASFNLHKKSSQLSKGAVQEPNAFLGRHLIHATEALVSELARRGCIDRVACKDLGAGGIACASVEIAESGGYGAYIDLDKVHATDSSISDYVLLCAETQERYIWVCESSLTPVILDHFNTTFSLGEVSYGARASVIGHITKETDYVVVSKGKTLVHAPAADVTRGFLYHREVGIPPAYPPEPNCEDETDTESMFLHILSHPNVASRTTLYNRYDKQVQGLVVCEAGEGDAGIITPFADDEYPQELHHIGITLTCDQNPRYNLIDAYRGAAHALLESYRNTVATGATPIAISDCLCYGNPEHPESMAQFVQGCTAVAHTAKTIGIPVIAGNVSLYNETEEQRIAPSPMIAMVGKLDDVRLAVPSSFCKSNSTILLLGERKNECGGSIYYDILGHLGHTIPAVQIEETLHMGQILLHCAKQRLILSCHDIAEGGVAIALAEMSFRSHIGCSVTITSPFSESRTLFSETPGFLVEVSDEGAKQIQKMAKELGLYCCAIGKTTQKRVISINTSISLPIEQAYRAWSEGLADHIG